jgi:acyl transferase domain-containing protein
MTKEHRTDRTEQLTPLQRAAYAVKEMRAKLDAIERAQTEPIAIIGMSCRFPGARNCDEFWQLLREGREAITEVPKERWDVNVYYDPDPNAPGKINTRYGGFLSHIDLFDPHFFGISPQEAMYLDPQHRLLLEVTWEALENAGQDPKSLTGSQTGIFIGMNTNDYGMQNFSTDPATISAYSATGNGFCFASGRLSYFFGLHGPNMPIDTACSSSLVALHVACQSLRLKECDLAVVGGVQLHLSPALTIALAKTQSLSPDGRCKTFDASADGFGMSEGCGVVVLKRYSDAVANRDYVQALIRGSAINHDGPSSGITVPNQIAQEKVIQQALHNARVTPSEVSYVETHGTGTSLGDPIEVEALNAVFGKDRSRDNPLLIGTVKTNIAHTVAAAGIGGLIKVALALQHQEIPPHLHFNTPNPHIDWKTFPVAVPTKCTPWTRGENRRIAGVSSFGITGTNAHIILEEAPEDWRLKIENSQSSIFNLQSSIFNRQSLDRPLHLLTLSARTEPALRELVKAYEAYLNFQTEVSLGDLCFTANAGRTHFNYRLAVMAESCAQLQERLSAFAAGKETPGLWRDEIPVRAKPLKIAFLFSDGASQQVLEVGRQLYETQPDFRKTIEKLKAACEKLTLTEHEIPASLFISFALAELWQSWGLRPAAVLGQHKGEYVATWVAGGFSLEDALKLIAAGDGSIPPVSFQRPRIPIISGMTGQILPPEYISDAGYWQRVCQEESRLSSGLNTLIEKGCDCILEIGTKLALNERRQSSIINRQSSIVMSSLNPEQDDWQVLLSSLATLYVHGATINWNEFDKDYPWQRIPLPTYPFQRKRYWLNTETSSAKETPLSAAHETESKPALTTPVGLARIMNQQLNTVSQTVNQIISHQLEFLRNKGVFASPLVGGVRGGGVETAIAALGKHPLPEHFVSQRKWQLLVISAQTEADLDAGTKKLVAHLKAHPECNLSELAYALQQVQAFPHRRMAVCRDVDDAITVFETLDPKRVNTKCSRQIERSIVFMFPGVGDHYVNMARGLYQTEPVFRAQVDWCSERLIPLLKKDLREILYPDQPDEDNAAEAAQPRFDLRKMLNRGRGKPDKATETLNQTLFIHPAIFIIDYALAKLWMQWGIQPQGMIGYSIGEYVAACLAGVMSPEDALVLLTKRAQLIQELPPGAMLTVTLAENELAPMLTDDLSIAVISTPSQCVVAGPLDAVNVLENRLKDQEILCRRVQNFHPVHSKMMDPIRKSLTRLVETILLHPPEIPYISNITGTWITSEQATDPQYWVQHTCQTARFADGIGVLLQTPGRILLEVGPGQNLGSFALQHPSFQKENNIVVLSSLKAAYDQQPDEVFWLNMLGKIWLVR